MFEHFAFIQTHIERDERILTVGRPEGGKALGKGRLEVAQSARGGLAQMRMEFGEVLLDGVWIWAVGRQVAHAGLAGCDQRGDTVPLRRPSPGASDGTAMG